MEPSTRTRIQELLRVASRLPAAARASFLEHAEPRRAPLRDEVLSLLAFEDGRGELVAAPLAEPTEVGPYRLLDRLGEAPPARLYRACRSDDPGRAALLAVAGPGPAAASVAAALAEQAQRQRALDDPDLARLLEAGATPDGRLFAAFEPLDAVPLGELGDALRLPLAERVALVEQVARIVARAHAAGVAPLGLLPWSVLAGWSGSGPRAALIAIDPWPLLALLEPERRAEAELLAGLETSPPEALRGEPRGVASDVFALGVLLYEALTGTLPLGLRRLAGRRTLREELRLAARLSPPLASARIVGLGSEARALAALRGTSVERLLQSLRSGLDPLLARALAAEPGDRPASAEELASELAAWRCASSGSSGLLDAARRLGRRLAARNGGNPPPTPPSSQR